LRARLIESHLIAPEVKHFVFEAAGAGQLHYLPGQFVSLTEDLDGKQITRAYSIASAPSGNRFELCLNRVQDGIFSPYLFDLQPGSEVDMQGPLGYFTWREPLRECVLVATGTGIAPFRAMLQQRLPLNHPHTVTLVFGTRYRETLLYRAEFEELSRRFANFRFWPTLSRPETEWTGRTGYVQQHALEAVGERRDLDVYICGLKAMVDDMRQRLKTIGFDRKQIIVEKYD
jgi:CDP-4-dehydro-6-deoxyglucose reductase